MPANRVLLTALALLLTTLLAEAPARAARNLIRQRPTHTYRLGRTDPTRRGFGTQILFNDTSLQTTRPLQIHVYTEAERSRFVDDAETFALQAIKYLSDAERDSLLVSRKRIEADRQVIIDFKKEEEWGAMLDRFPKVEHPRDIPPEYDPELMIRMRGRQWWTIRHGFMNLIRGYRVVPPKSVGEKPRIEAASLPWREEEPALARYRAQETSPPIEWEFASYRNVEPEYSKMEMEMAGLIALRELSAINLYTDAGIAAEDARVSGITRGKSRVRYYVGSGFEPVKPIPDTLSLNTVGLAPLLKFVHSPFMNEVFPHFKILQAKFKQFSLGQWIRLLDRTSEAQYRVYDFARAGGGTLPIALQDHSAGAASRIARVAQDAFPHDAAEGARLSKTLLAYYRAEPASDSRYRISLLNRFHEKNDVPRDNAIELSGTAAITDPAELRAAVASILGGYRAESGFSPRLRVIFAAPEAWAREHGGRLGVDDPAQYTFLAEQLAGLLGNGDPARTGIGYSHLKHLLQAPLDL
jgi:hypothetical protein